MYIYTRIYKHIPYILPRKSPNHPWHPWHPWHVIGAAPGGNCAGNWINTWPLPDLSARRSLIFTAPWFPEENHGKTIGKP